MFTLCSVSLFFVFCFFFSKFFQYFFPTSISQFELTKPSGWKVKHLSRVKKKNPVDVIQAFERYHDLDVWEFRTANTESPSYIPEAPANLNPIVDTVDEGKLRCTVDQVLTFEASVFVTCFLYEIDCSLEYKIHRWIKSI